MPDTINAKPYNSLSMLNEIYTEDAIYRRLSGLYKDHENLTYYDIGRAIINDYLYAPAEDVVNILIETFKTSKKLTTRNVALLLRNKKSWFQSSAYTPNAEDEAYKALARLIVKEFTTPSPEKFIEKLLELIEPIA